MKKGNSAAKLMSLLLAVVMALAMLSVTAFASAAPDIDDTDIVGTINVDKSALVDDEDAAATDPIDSADEGAVNDDADAADAAAAGVAARNRYIITGGVILAIGIGFYAILSVSSKKKKAKK